MGLIARWLARRGAVGGTARWAVNGYRFFRSRHPKSDQFPDPTIFRLMIADRLQTLPNARHEKYLLARCDQVDGLMGLVIEILKVEASLADNDVAFMVDIADVIWDELAKSKLPRETLYGRASLLSDYQRVMFEKPAL